MKKIFRNFLNFKKNFQEVFYFTILGPDGAGKSTLISMLIEKLNFLKVDSGFFITIEKLFEGINRFCSSVQSMTL